MKARTRRWLAVVTAVYGLAVLLIGFWSSPVDRPVDGTLFRVLAWLHAHGVPAWFGYHAVEFGANIALFIPVGFLIGLILPARHWWLAAVSGAVASCAIELGQLMLLPARHASWEDIAANSAGSICGAILAVIVHALARRVAARRR